MLDHGRHQHPEWLWRSPEPRTGYDAIIVGAGGHGLATAYYLAERHGMTDVAVLARGWLGGGNLGRNTTIIRSNSLWDESAAIYEHPLELWELLAQELWEVLAHELDYELLFDQRGVLNLAHSLPDVREGMRRTEADRVNGVDAEWLDIDAVGEICPLVNVSPDVRYPVLGGTLQRRARIAKHDHVAWAFARGAAARGVDLIQGCEVTGILTHRGRVAGVETTHGCIEAPRVALAAAGHTSVLADMVGLRLPVRTHALDALVCELPEPVLDCVVMSNAVHVHVSQAHKGELVMGAGIDPYNGYGRRGSFHAIEAQMAAALELFPVFAQADVLRSSAGIVDVTPDTSPILGLTPLEGLFINCGWGTGGFTATPGAGWVYAQTIATEEPHPLAEPFALERFASGALIDEHGAAAVAH
jgi:sarcosine oxidase subunit beta